MNYTQSVSRIFLALFIMFFMVFGISTTSAKAQETIESDRIAELIDRIQELQAQVKALQEQYAGLQTEIQEVMQLTRTLSTGMSGEDVEELQELLATDTELYPEGLVTGFYGPMTERAIERLQARFGIEQVGNVGPITQRTLNELFKNYRKEQKNIFKAISVEVEDGEDDDEVDFTEYQPGVTNVLICHGPRGNESKKHTIAVGGPAVQVHIEGHGDSFGSCDGDEDGDEDSDEDDGDDDDDDDDDGDDDGDDDESEETTKGEALDAIGDAEAAIGAAQEAIDDALDSGLDVGVAEQLLEDAEVQLADANEAFDDALYEDAEELADDAEDTADEAREEAEDTE